MIMVIDRVSIFICVAWISIGGLCTRLSSQHASAFAPSVSSARQWRLGSSPEQKIRMTGQDEASKALEQAAKLRQEIAHLEQDLAKGTSTS